MGMSKIDDSLAFLFPGQGSQSLGMMQELAAAHPEVVQIFRRASDVLGYDLWRLVADGPVEQLNLTLHTQPAMLAAAWRERLCFVAGGNGAVARAVSL